VEAGKVYCLAACRHVYCKECMDNSLSTAAANQRFPICCTAAADGGVCNTPICTADLLQSLKGEELQGMYKAACRSFIAHNAASWGNCFSPDCPQVSGSSAQRMHTVKYDVYHHCHAALPCLA
jgi:hypothetical protein